MDNPIKNPPGSGQFLSGVNDKKNLPGRFKKHLCSSLVFLFNVSLLGLVIFLMKEKDRERKELQEDVSESVTPISGAVNESQGEITGDREQKLRDLNSAPKTAEQQQVTTDTAVTTTTPPSSSSSSTTKKSSTTTKTS